MTQSEDPIVKSATTWMGHKSDGSRTTLYAQWIVRYASVIEAARAQAEVMDAWNGLRNAALFKDYALQVKCNEAKYDHDRAIESTESAIRAADQEERR